MEGKGEKSGFRYPITIGMNGIGRIGKQLLWLFIARKTFPRMVVNLGREMGPVGSPEALADYLLYDSAYGPLAAFMYGAFGRERNIINAMKGGQGLVSVTINDVEIALITDEKNRKDPRNINWSNYGVDQVVESTGGYLDPGSEAGEKGAIRSHIDPAGGAEICIVSAPFKKKGGKLVIPDDAATILWGINHGLLDISRHRCVSAASCTTTAAAYVIYPLIKAFGASRVLAIDLNTVHAVTPSQNITDKSPKAKAKPEEWGKSRSGMNNIIITSTGVKNALSRVIEEVKNIPFSAKSIRVPTITGSLAIISLDFREHSGKQTITDEAIIGGYRKFLATSSGKYLKLSERTNCSTDIIGAQFAAIIDLPQIEVGFAAFDQAAGVTRAKIFAWYDNEMGYANLMSETIEHIAACY